MNVSLLEARREALGLEWSEIAERCGVNVTTLWRWRKGRESPKLATALKLASVRKVNPQSLWRDDQ